MKTQPSWRGGLALWVLPLPQGGPSATEGRRRVSWCAAKELSAELDSPFRIPRVRRRPPLEALRETSSRTRRSLRLLRRAIGAQALNEFTDRIVSEGGAQRKEANSPHHNRRAPSMRSYLH